MSTNQTFDIVATRNQAVTDYVQSANKGENGMAKLAYVMHYAWTQGVSDERFPFNPADMVTPGSDKLGERMERALVWFGAKVPDAKDGTKYVWAERFNDAFRRSFPQALRRAAMIAGATVKAEAEGHGSPKFQATHSILTVPACVLAGSTDGDALAKALGKGTDADDPIKLNGKGGASLAKAGTGARKLLGYANKGTNNADGNKRPGTAKEAAALAQQLGNFLRTMTDEKGNYRKPSGDLRDELIGIACIMDEMFTNKDRADYNAAHESDAA